MFRLKMSFGIASLLVLGMVLMSADHTDAPAVTGGTADIADFYAFESTENSDNLVFAATLQGLLSPGQTGMASFDENVLIEFNIDNDADNVEDFVIQLIPRDGKMYAFGPYAPSSTGVTSSIDESVEPIVADITKYGDSASIGTDGTSKLFAGPRDDPFFFDLGAYSAILAGNASGFDNPGTDSFAGTNVLAVVIEVPKSSLNSTGSVNTWVETKTRK